MHHNLSSWRLLLLLTAVAAVSASSKPDAEKASSTTSATAIATPCVATSTSGAFYDLRPDMAVVVKDGEKQHKGVPVEDYTYAKPHDWPYNFTMNVCSPVVKGVKNVVGVDKYLWTNISAYYELEGKVYSLGQLNTTLVPRGSQLVLRYSGGSPCALGKNKDKRGAVHDGASYKHYNYEDDEDDDASSSIKTSKTSKTTSSKDDDKEKDGEKKDKDTTATRRKSAIISFRCDRDPATTQAKLSFLEVDEDECTYVFSILSQHACAKTEPHKPGSVGPGGVFAIIFFVAVLVYLVGGVFYQRTVTHARGWRQLPNYSLWAGIWSFVQDIFIILTSSCACFLPGRRGYRALSISPNGRGRNPDDENRLIDQLDEEWDD